MKNEQFIKLTKTLTDLTEVLDGKQNFFIISQLAFLFIMNHQTTKENFYEKMQKLTNQLIDGYIEQYGIDQKGDNKNENN